MPTPMKLPDDWQPFDDVYRDFAEANPMLKLNASQFAAGRLRQQYGAQLIAAGAALKLPNRLWFASREKFGPALWAAMVARREEILARAQAEPADATH